MMRFPADWVVHHGEHLVTAYPPAGGGRFRFHQRLRPPPDLTAIVERILDGDPAFATARVAAPVRLTTAEGEHAAWVIVDGTRDDRRARRAIGAVITEDFACALDALLTVPSRFAELERRALELLASLSLRLGVRPRLMSYDAPPGWRCLPAGLHASFYPPDFPRIRASILVPPAMPMSGEATEAINDALAGAAAGLQVEAQERASIAAACGLRGSAVRVLGTRPGARAPTARELVALCAPPYLYTMQLEAAAGEHVAGLRACFHAAAASIRPVPRPHDPARGPLLMLPRVVLDHWV